MLTTQQLQTLKTDIANDATLNAFPNTPDGAFEIAAAYSLPASPDFWVWRTHIPQAEIVGTTTTDGTTWSWSAYIARSQGERDGWREMFADGGFINGALANVRQGLADIFSGASNNAPQQRTHLLTVARRKSNRVEKLYAVGTGSTGSPATMVIEGTITYQDVLNARNLP